MNQRNFCFAGFLFCLSKAFHESLVSCFEGVSEIIQMSAH